jgi:plastocyanin
MGKWFGAIAAAALVAVSAGPGAGPVAADDMNMGATCSPAGTSLALTAQDHKFDKDCLAVPAGQSFTIRFDNKDSDRHNVAILPSHTSTETFFQGDIVPGPKGLTYNVPALKAGTFHFHCQVHPNLMNGVFIVGTAAAAPAPAPAPKPAPTPPPTMSVGADKPAAEPAPAPKTAAAMPAMPAPAPKAAAAATPAPAGTSAGATTGARRAAGTLPHTGPHSARLLLLLAGILFAVGGLSVVGGARRAEFYRP